MNLPFSPRGGTIFDRPLSIPPTPYPKAPSPKAPPLLLTDFLLETPPVINEFRFYPSPPPPPKRFLIFPVGPTESIPFPFGTDPLIILSPTYPDLLVSSLIID